jgi:hypothetical protein
VLTVHAHSAALVSTKLVAATIKSCVPTENALTQPSPSAQLLLAQLKCLLSALTDNALLPLPTVHQLLLNKTSLTAPMTSSVTSFLALMVLALLLLNNADQSSHANLHSSSDAVMVHADQPKPNAQLPTLAHLPDLTDAHLVCAPPTLLPAHPLPMAAQVLSRRDALRPVNVSAIPLMPS